MTTLRLEDVTPAVLAHLANTFLGDFDVTSLGCTNVALLHALRSAYDLKTMLMRERYRHVATPRSLPRLDRITLGVARHARIIDRIGEWRSMLADGATCRLWAMTLYPELLATSNGAQVVPPPSADATDSKPIDWTWPTTTRSLTLRNYDFVQTTLDVDLAFLRIPKHLTKLEFTHRIRVSHVQLAEFTGLRELDTYEPFECAYADLVLPSELTSLQFGGCSSGSIADLRLPESLTSLSFTWDFNHSLEGVRLPPSLRVLSFGFSWNHPIDKIAFPPQLHMLVFGNYDRQPLDALSYLPRLVCDSAVAVRIQCSPTFAFLRRSYNSSSQWWTREGFLLFLLTSPN